MASVYKRKDGKGWRAVIRMKGYPTVCETFDRKQEADDWAKETERRIKLGQFNFTAHNKHHTYADLLHRMEGDGAFDLQRSFKNCLSQFNYWKQRLGAYALIHITPELIAQSAKPSSRHPSLTALNAPLPPSIVTPPFLAPLSPTLSKNFAGSLRILIVHYPS